MVNKNTRIYTKINNGICKSMKTNLDTISLALFNDDKPLDIPELYEFCKWWVKKYPDKFITLKGKLYDFRAERAKLFDSVSFVFSFSKEQNNKMNSYNLFQLQLLTNNCIDQTNATCQIVELIIKMCEQALKESK